MKEGAIHTSKFMKTTCSVDPASKWPNITEHEKIFSSLLNDTPIILAAADQGRSKDVFKGFSLSYGEQNYAAKTFRGSKDAIHEYPIYNEFLFELACVQRLASFTNEFFEEVRGQGIKVEAFTITEAFIIQVVQETAENISCAYLVEPLRSSTATIKFLGTLMNRVASGRRAAGKSGSGDHGPEGIQAFIDSHCCTAVCHSMQLLLMEDVNETVTWVLEDNQAKEEAQLDMPLEPDDGSVLALLQTHPML
ncbi:hypothetical protein JB92DRAFT_2830332 [Gautieria morchelliformis]|nr:hypothetical protein JB92DRAFT_2830332 [Gautieria morchelliformis]